MYLDVADLQPPTRAHHAEHLAQGLLLVRSQVEHAVGDHHVGPAVGYREVLHVGVAELDVVDARLGGSSAEPTARAVTARADDPPAAGVSSVHPSPFAFPVWCAQFALENLARRR